MRGTVIGRITITARKSFVGLPKDTADKLLSRLQSLNLRNQEVPMSLARPREMPPEQAGRQPERSAYKGRPKAPYPARQRGRGGHGPPQRRPTRGFKRGNKH